MNIKRYLSALALATVLLAGCASQQASPAPAVDVAPAPQSQAAPTDAAPIEQSQAEARPTLPDACALLTQADLTQVLAEPFGAGEPGEMPVTEGAAFVPTNCAFHSGDKQIVLTLFLASTYEAHKDLAAIGDGPSGVSGVGEDAFWDPDAQEIIALQGNFVATLGFDFMEASPDVAAPLMQQALSRLK